MWMVFQVERLSEVAQEGDRVKIGPELVVEIAFNDLQRSPNYPGGLALRDWLAPFHPLRGRFSAMSATPSPR